MEIPGGFSWGMCSTSWKNWATATPPSAGKKWLPVSHCTVLKSSWGDGRRSAWKVICTFYCHWPRELPRGPTPLEETSYKVQRRDRHAYTARKAGNLQQSNCCRASRGLSLWSGKWDAMRPNCSTTWNRLKYILVTLFVSIYITFWFSK